MKIAAVMENTETIKRSVGNGMGVAVISRLAAREEIRSGKLLAFPLGDTGGRRNINLVFDAGYPSLPSADKFIKNIREMFPECG